jgi:hypothetical protein
MSDSIIANIVIEDAGKVASGSGGKKKTPMTLTDLPEELLLYLATFLNGRDVVHLSHVNQVKFLNFFFLLKSFESITL